MLVPGAALDTLKMRGSPLTVGVLSGGFGSIWGECGAVMGCVGR